MEDVLAVYKRPRDLDVPLVCLDETSKQLLADTRAPIPMKPGQRERRDYEYERNGTANLFMMFAPLEGWRYIEITDRRTAIDYAHALEALSDTHFPNAKKIILVQDNLWTPPAQGDLLVPTAWNARIYPACCGTFCAPGLDGSPLLLAS
jgi:DDE superfamily endonuclease